MKLVHAAIGAILALCASAALAQSAAPRLVTTDFFVPMVSTLPVNAGQTVGIHVRRKVAEGEPAGGRPRPVVLFVHGATVPAVPDFDLDYKSYNWMAFLARAGFDTYAMDHTGYGSSPRPMMDDPCNADPKQQRELMPRPLKAACEPHYPHEITTIHSDWAEIDAVVDHLRAAHTVPKIHIIGWSAGGPRVGGYAGLHPEKVDRIVLYAPSPTVAKDAGPRPAAGFPMVLQSREDMEKKRWDPDVRCPGQVEPGVRDAVWKAIMQWDRIGAQWGPAEGIMRGRSATGFGWTADLAKKVVAPALVIVGEFDRLAERRTVFEQISSQDKVFLDVACGSHFMVWEMQHPVLHETSLEWLTRGEVRGVKRGEFRVDAERRYTRR